MKFPQWLDVYGDQSFRDKKCPKETVEQITLFAELRKNYPEIGAIAIHVRNEGKRTWEQAAMHKAEGMISGACDIIIPGSPSLVMELKRRDHTVSKWQPGQLDYLEASRAAGSYVCVALGWQAALNAILTWWTGQQNG